MYKLKNNNGKVRALLRSGKDMVLTELSFFSAQYIIDHGEQGVSPFKDYPIAVDNKWYFAGERIRQKRKSASKSEDKNG